MNAPALGVPLSPMFQDDAQRQYVALGWVDSLIGFAKRLGHGPENLKVITIWFSFA